MLARARGDLEMKWLRANGCPWGQWTCWRAAEGGHLEVLKWLRANGRPWGSGRAIGRRRAATWRC